MTRKKPSILLTLSVYYGVLQCLHLFILLRAGILLFFYHTVPFPILPPPGGWHAQTFPFLYGLAGMDGIGIFLGILFAYKALFSTKIRPILGLVSLTIFISGALVFAAGTLPSGAWAAHPVSYGAMLVLFIPIPVLYVKLLLQMHNSK
jgi:hypothetical protein